MNNKERFTEKAIAFAKETGYYDTVEYCGEKDGYCYFILLNSKIKGKYLGVPFTVKYNIVNGERIEINTHWESMMAFHMRYNI